MKQSALPALFSTPFGADAAAENITQPIPATTSTSGRASLEQGFPSVCFQPIASGGVPPFGQDVNGIFYMLSASAQAQQAGVLPPWNSTFAGDIGGYPQNAIVADGSTAGLFWVSTADNNTSQPGASGASWQSLTYGLAPLASPAFTGSPTVPKAGSADASGLIASTAWATAMLSAGWGLAQNIAASGSLTLPGGVIVKWGNYTSGSGGLSQVAFQGQFPNSALAVIVAENSADGTWTKNSPVFHGTYGLSVSGFNIVTRGLDSGSSTGWGAQSASGYYIALGR